MIKVLLIGTDINAYSMARSYHEIYNKKVDVIGDKLFESIKEFITV